MTEFTYCEAIHPAGAVQYWNIASGLVFAGLAAFVWRGRGHGRHRYGLVGIAAGSIAWHASQLQWGLYLDFGAILVWAALYTVDLTGARGASLRTGLMALLGGVLVSGLCGWLLADWVSLLSGAFIPYASLMLLMACVKGYPQSLRWVCSLSAIAMALAIVARVADLPVCHSWGGAHWLWHLLAGLSLLGPIRLIDHYGATAAPQQGAVEGKA